MARVCLDCQADIGHRGPRAVRCEVHAKEHRIKTARDRANKWYKKNSDRARKNRKKRYWDDPESAREASRAWYTANKEQASERDKQRYAQNKALFSERHREYYIANRDAIRERVKEYRASKIERYRTYNRNNARRRRALTKASFVEFVSSDVVYERDKWICQLCGFPVDKTLKWPDPGSPSLDHIVPLNKGGNHSYENVQLAHLGCNNSRQDKSIEEWRMYRG